MPNAVQMIKQDHRKVASLFDKYKNTKGEEAKRRIAEQAIEQLEVHALVEEDIFYPAVEKALGDGALIHDALKEHQVIKELIEELKTMEDYDEDFEEKWSELVENVQYHVNEEESDLLLQAEESELDLVKCGTLMTERRAKAIEEIGASSMVYTAKLRPGSRTKKSTKHSESRHA
jgi:signal recognition particle subunit SEC65